MGGSFVHLYDKYLLLITAHYIQGTILDAKDTTMNKTGMIPALMGSLF